MFWHVDKTKEHGLARNPWKACVVPRPIGWITTIGPSGDVNLAPYSYFNACGENPCMVMFSGGPRPEGPMKDTVANAEQQGEFVANIATWDLRDEMNRSSAALPTGVDEMEFAGLETEPSQLVKPPRVKASPIHLECVYHTTVVMPNNDGGEGNRVVFGRVLGIHIRDNVLTNGLVDMEKVKPIARLGYMDYTRVDLVFAMDRPRVKAEAAE
ncbi:MAG: flavin reductase family protein [Rhodospirillaceae bacterium]